MSNNEQAEKELVERFIQFYDAFQIDDMADLLAKDCIFQNVSNSAGYIRGKEEFLKLATQSALMFETKGRQLGDLTS